MTDITDLKADVLLLRQENKELRERLEESEHDAITAWDRALKAESVSKGLRMARDVWQENDAKLRELVQELWEGYNDPRCEECQLKDTPTCADCPICAREALVIDRMRELGIEVGE